MLTKQVQTNVSIVSIIYFIYNYPLLGTIILGKNTLITH